MRYLSTRKAAPAVRFTKALVEGLAPDGGLYMPERLEPLPTELLANLAGTGLAAIAAAVGRTYFDDLPESDLAAILADALSFDTPLVRLGDGTLVLELFHGPTLAFKDVGARTMARLMAAARAEGEGPLTVLVATSGDTGSAVAHAFWRVPQTRVVVLYPAGRVSALQERQFTTLGQNVHPLAVRGSFDDCQRLAKEAFGDRDLKARTRLTSANSINIGRLLPQMFYYFRAVAQLAPGVPPALFSTPSGNFGNLTAGLMAERLGLPCAGFVAATNVNDVVPEYLATGRFSPRPSVPTLSNAMDVGHPSNFDRILWLFGADRDALRQHVQGSRHDDAETIAAIRGVYHDTGYVLDPHTAVGFLGLRRGLAAARGPVSGIVLATAHPAKFREHVEAAIGEAIPLPERLLRCLNAPTHEIPMEPTLEALRAYLVETRDVG
jgi:threonine synthase